MKRSLNYRNITLLSTIFFCGLLAFLAFKLYQSEGFIPVDIDEVPYYYGGQTFSETGSVRFTSCWDGNVSRWFQCNWYGPLFPIIFGFFFIGFSSSKSFLAFNLLLVLGLFCFGLFQLVVKRNQIGHLYLWSMFNPVTLIFCAYYFPVVILLLIGLFLISRFHILFLKVTEVRLHVFIVLCFCAGLFRQNFVLWIVALIPFYSYLNVNQRWRILLMGFLAVLLSFFWHFYFCAKPEAPYGIADLSSVCGNLKSNLIILSDYCLSYKDPWYFPFFFTLFSPLLFWKRLQNKFCLGLFFILLTHILFSALFYSFHPYFFTRISVVIFPVIIYGLLSQIKPSPVLTLMGLFIWSGTCLYATFWAVNHYRQGEQAYLANRTDQFKPALSHYFSKEVKKDVSSIICYVPNYMANMRLLNNIPYSVNNQPISYIVYTDLLPDQTRYPALKITHVLSATDSIINGESPEKVKNYFIYSR